MKPADNDLREYIQNDFIIFDNNFPSIIPSFERKTKKYVEWDIRHHYFSHGHCNSFFHH